MTQLPSSPKGDNQNPSDAELVAVGAARDDVELVHRDNPFPTPGTKAEKRAERIVASFFLLTFLASVAFVVIYIAWPWKYHTEEHKFLSYWTYTPALGICMALALFGVGAGVVAWGKLLMPHEEAIQYRHDGRSEPVDRDTAAATVRDGLNDTGVTRRSAIRRSLLVGGGGLLAMLLVAPIGGFIKKPHGLGKTSWRNGVRLMTSDRRPIRPGDMDEGGMQTAFPDVPGGLTAADSSIMLIRLRPGQRIKARKGQADFTWNDYIAFSKICTHAGCPVSLYEQQTGRILCPCHQSQFDVLQDGKPVFGPATRSLPQLPITVDSEGFFVATGDFREPIGPAYWERA